MDKVLILGVNGFTGRYFQRYIASCDLLNKFVFVGVDRTNQMPALREYRQVDLLRFKEYEELLIEEKPNYIINFAGVFNAASPEEMERINAGIARDTFEIILSRKLRIKNILLIGSAAEYGANRNLPLKEGVELVPINPYGLSKVLQTAYARFYCAHYNIKVNVARTFNVIGKGISPLLSIGSFVEQLKNAKNGDTIFVGNLNTKRDFLDAGDVVRAYWKILMCGKQGQDYNVCSGRSYRIKDILDFLIKESGKRVNIKVKQEFLRKNDILDSYGDNRKLKRDTGWKEEKDIFVTLLGIFENENCIDD